MMLLLSIGLVLACSDGSWFPYANLAGGAIVYAAGRSLS